jgi:Na+-translocating ferredoxin:NAD+ oxidoreductase RnfD subunit
MFMSAYTYKKFLAGILLFTLYVGQSVAAPTTPTTATTPSANQLSSTSQSAASAVAPKPPSLETQFTSLKKLSKTQSTRLDSLEIANHNALSQNQTLQLENDNLKVQVKALQSDRSAQMFLYGAVAILVGAIIGWIVASQFSRRTRRW